MADTEGSTNIRGLDIDKTVKGFALLDYTFMNECLVSPMNGDSVRWYQETSTDLTATAPSYVQNISPLSSFPTLEASWTRNTSYVKKFAAEGFLSMEDIKSADIDILSRTLLRLTRTVQKQVDAAIYAVARTVTNTFATTAVGGDQWDDTGANVIADLLNAKKLISDYGYSPEGASLLLSTQDYRAVLSWLISTKGSSIPQFASEKVVSGTVMNLVGLNVKVSPNVTNDEALVIVPQQAVTWKSYQDITARQIEDPGIGTKIRVFQMGIPILTDNYAGCLITDTQK